MENPIFDKVHESTRSSVLWFVLGVQYHTQGSEQFGQSHQNHSYLFFFFFWQPRNNGRHSPVGSVHSQLWWQCIWVVSWWFFPHRNSFNDTAVTYPTNKYTLTESLVNTAIAAQVNPLERMGLTEEEKLRALRDIVM